MEPSPAAAGQQGQQQASTSSGASAGSSQGAQQQQQQQQQLPPTHKPLTHNPPTSPKSTPWPSPATGSPFPQLARPDDSTVGVISSSGRADRMSPTAAPWVAVPPAAAGGPPSSQLMTGKPVQGLIQAEARMPLVVQPAASTAAGFKAAAKAIQSAEDLKAFLGSDTAKGFVGFILALNAAVGGTKLGQQVALSPVLQQLKSMLDDLYRLVDSTPAVQQSLRYGNPAFRTWFGAMSEQAPGMMQQLLPQELSGAAIELLPYWLDSFGNPTRIDYGTGHETTFVAFLYCLAALGLVTEVDNAALVCVVFNRYLELMRHIQTTFWLEPAGSHGVWGLDDYQFLPFVWGSGQLVGHPLIRPKSIHNTELLEAYGEQYMYLACVKFVKTVKKGSLHETSPMLDDVSSVPNWGKVNSGMIKMYQVEVLSKFPIMQHFLFGSLLPFERNKL